MLAESGNTLELKWNELTQTPAVIEGNLTKPSLHTPGWIAYGYLEKIKILYDLNRVKEDLAIFAVETSDNGARVYFQRQLFKKPVCGNQLVVEIDPSGVIHRIEGVLHAGLKQKRLGRPMYAAVTPKEAGDILLSHDASLQKDHIVNIESCYLPTRNGIPLVHVVTYKKENRPVSVKVHSLTGRLIE